MIDTPFLAQAHRDATNAPLGLRSRFVAKPDAHRGALASVLAYGLAYGLGAWLLVAAVILAGSIFLHGCGPAPSDCTPDDGRCEAAR